MKTSHIIGLLGIAVLLAATVSGWAALNAGNSCSSSFAVRDGELRRLLGNADHNRDAEFADICLRYQTARLRGTGEPR
jgi:hypothetical protein